MSSHREARAGSWRALVEEEQQQARELDATRAAAKAVAGSAAEAAAEPVLGPWPFAGVEAPSEPWVASGSAARAHETTHRDGLSA